MHIMEILFKQPSQLNLSDFSLVYEYLLLINPEGKAYDSTYSGKKDFSFRYKNQDDRVTPPHVTLANILQPDLYETEIINELKKIAESSNKIKVILKDYGWFDRVIYYNVEFKTDIQQLVRKIKSRINRFMITEKKLGADVKQQLAPHFILTPHITVCKDLTPEQLERSKIEYTSRKFYAEFVAKEMILLKRLGSDPYQEIGRFRFNGPDMLTIIRQGNLFQ